MSQVSTSWGQPSFLPPLFKRSVTPARQRHPTTKRHCAGLGSHLQTAAEWCRISRSWYRWTASYPRSLRQRQTAWTNGAKKVHSKKSIIHEEPLKKDSKEIISEDWCLGSYHKLIFREFQRYSGSADVCCHVAVIQNCNCTCKSRQQEPQLPLSIPGFPTGPSWHLRNIKANMKRPISEPTWTHTRTNALSPSSLNYPVAPTSYQKAPIVLCLRSKNSNSATGCPCQMGLSPDWEFLNSSDKPRLDGFDIFFHQRQYLDIPGSPVHV